MTCAIVSAAFGAEYERMSKATFPSHLEYARRIGAECHLLKCRKFVAPVTPHWEKLQIADLLGTYDRLIWLDADVFVRPNAPSLFEIVPDGSFGDYDKSTTGYRDYPEYFRLWRWCPLRSRLSP